MAAFGEKTAKPSKARPAGVAKILHEFAHDTNIEGVNNAGRSPSSIRKVIWLLIFVFLAALTVQDLVALTQEFLTWPVDVSTTIDHKDAIPFPSVTVCNQNRVSCRRLKDFLARCQVGVPGCHFHCLFICSPETQTARTSRSWSSCLRLDPATPPNLQATTSSLPRQHQLQRVE